MNSFGRIFRVTIFGESHGPAVGVSIDGCPAGLGLSAADLAGDLARRRGGGRGATQRAEADSPEITSGVFEGRTTGAPVTISFANADVDSRPYEEIRGRPRPGHADMAAHMKYGGFNDARGGGHLSGRLTVGLTAAGAVAKKIIAPVEVTASLLTAGGLEDGVAAAEAAAAEGDSVGGVVECTCRGVPAGLGEPFFDSAESVISHILFAIPGVKGVEFGAGFGAAAMRGSRYNDQIEDASGRTATNNSGGISGGITNGNEIVFRVAMRPTASIAREQETIDLGSGARAKISVEGRHDACIALRAPAVVEAAAAIALCDLMTIEGRIPRVKERGHGTA
jgi:chorismate synthase